MQKLREETENADAAKKKKEIDDANTGYGYGGKFGVEVCIKLFKLNLFDFS